MQEVRDLLFIDQDKFLIHPYIPGIPFHHPGHALCWIIISPGLVQVEQEANHEISFQHHAAYVLNIDLIDRTGNALILVEDIVHREFQLTILLFE